MPDRTHVELRPRDYVRLYVAVTARQRTPFNLEHRWGQYHRAWSSNGQIYYARADFSTPPFVTSAVLTAGPGDTFPKMAYDYQETLWLLFQRSNGSIYDTYQLKSYDDGATWGELALAFTGGKYPTINISPLTGITVRAAWVNNQIVATRQAPGDVNPSSQYVFTANGVAIAFADDSFHLAPAYDSSHRWVLTARALGASEISEWQSFDDALTWTLVT